MTRRSSALALALAALAASPRAAAAPAARPQRVGVLPLAFTGTVPDAGRELFASRLAEGLEAAAFDVFAGPAVARELGERGPEIAACRARTCYPEVARSLEVGYLVVASVGERGKSYDILLHLVNGRTGALVAAGRERCETCGIEEAGEKMALAASGLRARLEALTRTPARFVIRSNPGAAKATIDGKAVGRTPVDMQLAGGEHRLVLTLAGHQRVERTFTAVSGVDETLDLDLARQPSVFPYRQAGWAAIVVGAVAVAAGIYGVLADGQEIRCEPSEKDAGGHCPFVRDTAGLGATLVGVGAIAGSLGGISLWMGSRDEAEEEPETVVARSFGFSFRGRF